MFKMCCGDCGECWLVGNSRTCKCLDEKPKQSWHKAEYVQPLEQYAYTYKNTAALAVNGEILRVTPDGQFIWHPDADQMIKEGDFTGNPAMPHILRALRKPKWVGLTTEEASEIYNSKHNEYAVDLDIGDFLLIYMAIEAKLKDKNT